MIDTATLLTFAVAAVALALTPGPDMVFVMTRSIAQGRLAGLVSVLGFAAGCYVHAAIAGLSLSGMLLVAPVVFDVVRWAGAAYILYLGVQAFRGVGGFRPPGGDAPKLPVWLIWRQALLCNVLNPKAALFFLALFPQFMRPEAETVLLQAMLLATLLNIACGLVNGGIALTAGYLGGWLGRHPDFVRWQNRLLGGIFAVMALRLAFDARR